MMGAGSTRALPPTLAKAPTLNMGSLEGFACCALKLSLQTVKKFRLESTYRPPKGAPQQRVQYSTPKERPNKESSTARQIDQALFHALHIQHLIVHAHTARLHLHPHMHTCMYAMPRVPCTVGTEAFGRDEVMVVCGAAVPYFEWHKTVRHWILPLRVASVGFDVVWIQVVITCVLSLVRTRIQIPSPHPCTQLYQLARTP